MSPVSSSSAVDDEMKNRQLRRLHLSLIDGGQRHLVTPEEAKQLRQRWQQQLRQAQQNLQRHVQQQQEEEDDDDDDEEKSASPPFTLVVSKLDISCRVWTDEALKELFSPSSEGKDDLQLTKRLQEVEVLRLDDIIASLLTEKGLATWQFLADLFTSPSLGTTGSTSSRLQELNVSDNALGTRGMEILQAWWPHCPHLQHLALNNVGLAEEDGETLARILLTPLQGSEEKTLASQLRSLLLSRNQMGPKGAEHVGRLLAQCPQLQVLHYAGCRPLAQGTAHLAHGLAQMVVGRPGTLLRELRLEDVYFDASSIDDLYIILAHSPYLSCLCLRDAELEKGGLTRVCQALTASGALLRELDVGSNGELGVSGAQTLVDFLVHTGQGPWLQSLYVDANELGEDGVALLLASSWCQSSAHSTLPAAWEKIDLSENELQTGFGIELALMNYHHHHRSSEPTAKSATRRQLILRDHPELPPETVRAWRRACPSWKFVVDDENEDEDNEDDEEKEEATEDDGDEGAILQLTDTMAGTHLF